MSGMLSTDKLVFGWLEGFGAWSLDSATHNILLATIAYPAHASGSSNQMEEEAWRAQRKFLERLLKQTNLSPVMREAIEQLIGRAKDEEDLHGGKGGG
jgi:cytochrome P450